MSSPNPDFPVLSILGTQPERAEQMGSKRKFWFRDETAQLWLFKYARQGSGEDWAEKVAAELAQRLGLPCAYAEMAHCGDMPGVAVRAFTDSTTELVPGADLCSCLQLGP